MANIIAVVWDFDKTLVDGYMQDPIFNHYGIDAKTFWQEVNDLPRYYQESQQVTVNPDTIYLNHFLHYVESGKFAGLNNAKLTEFGKQVKFYPGVPSIFEEIAEMVSTDATCRDAAIKVEHYIVSTGMTAVVRGSKVFPFIEHIWGSELIEKPSPDSKGTVLAEIGYGADNTSKTRALFEINKGVNRNPAINVNSAIPAEKRRVPFENMIYIADGQSDIPAFSIVKRLGGATFAIYEKGDGKAMKQAEQLRKDGRIMMYAEADYSTNTTANLWIKNQILSIAERIGNAI